MRLQTSDFDSNCATGGDMRFQISEPKVIILYGYSSHNTTILSGYITYQHHLHVSANAAVAIIMSHAYSTGHEPTRHVQFIAIDKQDNTFYMLGSLPSAHTHPPTLCKTRSRPLTYTNTNK